MPRVQLHVSYPTSFYILVMGNHLADVKAVCRGHRTSRSRCLFQFVVTQDSITACHSRLSLPTVPRHVRIGHDRGCAVSGQTRLVYSRRSPRGSLAVGTHLQGAPSTILPRSYEESSQCLLFDQCHHDCPKGMAPQHS